MVRTTTPADEAAVIDTVVLAFASDPIARWCWPDSHTYLSTMGRFIRAFAGGSFDHGGAHCTSHYEGAALWMPPGVHSDDQAVNTIVEDSVAETLQGELVTMFEQMAGYHPAEPHWYLPLIGVDPAHQNNGHGAALMTFALERCDRERKLAYLESTNPRNVSLYLRHGFEALGTIQVGSSPPMVPMLRKPR